MSAMRSEKTAGRSTLLLDGSTAALLTAAGVAGTILLATLSFRFLESPLNAVAHRITGATPRKGAGVFDCPVPAACPQPRRGRGSGEASP